jgi:hypothetical protein
VVKIQSVGHLIGRPASSQDGHQLGRIVAVDCAPDDPYDAMWFVIRRGRLRAHLRAVPTEEASWGSDGLVVAFTRGMVMHSPALDGHGLSDAGARTAATAYYASQGGNA